MTQGTGQDSFSGRAGGWRQARDVLLEQIVDVPADSSGLILPALYCFRHYVELGLKALVEAAGPALDDEFRPVPWGHFLSKLWIQIKARARELGSPPTLLEEHEPMPAWLEFLDALDPKGETLRYPVPSESEGATLGVDTEFDQQKIRQLALQADLDLGDLHGWFSSKGVFALALETAFRAVDWDAVRAELVAPDTSGAPSPAPRAP